MARRELGIRLRCELGIWLRAVVAPGIRLEEGSTFTTALPRRWFSEDGPPSGDVKALYDKLVAERDAAVAAKDEAVASAVASAVKAMDAAVASAVKAMDAAVASAVKAMDAAVASFTDAAVAERDAAVAARDAVESKLSRLEEVFPLKPDTFHYYRRRDTTEMQKEMSLAAQCFESAYKGAGADTLKEILESRLKAFKQGGYYAKYVAVTNSSCLGKTKSVLELGRKGVFVFYCSTAKQGASTFPPRTSALAGALASTHSTAKMTFYLMAWLEELSEFVQGRDAEKDDLAGEWLKLQEKFTKSELPEKVLQRWMELGKTLGPQFTGDISTMVEEECKLQELLQKEIERVLEQVQFVDSEEHPRLKLLFVVDEAKGLLEVPPISEPVRSVPFLYLRRACQVLGRGTLLVVMDTTARVGELAPAGEDNESRRARAIDMKLLHPVCRVSSLDLFVDEMVPPRDVQAWLEDPLRWTKYGRPLWALRFGKERNLSFLLNLAQAKLLNLNRVAESMQGHLLQVNPVTLSESQALAMLAFTVGVEVVPGHHLAQEVSASNMSAMTIISNDRRLFWTVAPVEPVMSAAATGFFKDPEVLAKALQWLKEGLQAGHTTMSPGQRAELVASIYIMLAMWECWQQQQEQLFGRPRCVQTVNFMRQLVGDYADELPEELKASFTFFNRILCVDHVPSRKEALEYLKRGCACAGSLNSQNGAVDIYVFILCCSRGKQGRTGDYEFIEDNVTYARFSVKASKDIEPEQLQPAYIGIQIASDLPYITVAHTIESGEQYCVYMKAKDAQDMDKEGAQDMKAKDKEGDVKPGQTKLRSVQAAQLELSKIPRGKRFAKVNEDKGQGKQGQHGVNTEETIQGRWGVIIHGLEGPVSKGTYKTAIPILQEMMEVNSVVSACDEDKAWYIQYCPWAVAEFLPKELREQVKKDRELFRLRRTAKTQKETDQKIIKEGLHV